MARLEHIEGGVGELTSFAGRFALDVGAMLTSAAASAARMDAVAPDTHRLARYSSLALLRARATLRANEGICKDDLTPYELRCFSQNGEDGVLDEILWRIGLQHGTFVEFGVESGAEGNCVLLAEKQSWRGLFIEADPAHAARLHRRYKGYPLIQTLQSVVTPANINTLITDAGFAGAVDVLSIDIDGNDYWVWQAIDAISPSVVCIEYNAHIPHDQPRVQAFDPISAWDGTSYYGASIAALEALADTKGYRLVYTDLAGVNAFFVSRKYSERFIAADKVARRAPNFYLRGEEHPEDLHGRTMQDPGSLRADGYDQDPTHA